MIDYSRKKNSQPPSKLEASRTELQEILEVLAEMRPHFTKSWALRFKKERSVMDLNKLTNVSSEFECQQFSEIPITLPKARSYL